MKISKISIKHYRSCNEAVFIPHESLSALIGPNGSGKTNILSAIKLLPALCYDRSRRFLRDKDEPITSSCEIKTWYEIDGVSVSHTAKLNIVTNEKNQDEIINAHEYWYIPTANGRKKVVLPSWVILDLIQDRSPSNSGSNLRKNHLFRIFHRQGLDANSFALLEKVILMATGISYYSASQFTNPGSCPISFEVEGDSSRRTGISISGHKRLLYDMYQESRNNSASYSEFLGLVGQDGIGLVESIKFNEITTSTSNYSVMTGGQVTMKEKTNLLVVPSFQISGNSLSL